MTKRQLLKDLYKKGAFVMFVGILTGLTAGVIVTFFALAAELLAERSFDLYEAIAARPEFVPLLFLALAVGAFMIATLSYLLPMLGSNGVPQTEGVSRGILKMKWYQMLPAMAAASLISIFMGVNAGAEGPCMFIGGMCGDAVSRPFGSTDMERRYQITGGACAGVAVAANAPLTGIVFALEEAHRRFTPSILICSFSAVITAIITRNLLHVALGLEVASSLRGFVLVETPAIGYLYVALAALVSGLVGSLLMLLVKCSGKLMRRLTAARGFFKFLIVFLFTGAIGMITAYATGGGHSLINLLATNGGSAQQALKPIFGSPIALTLFAVIVLRLAALALGIGAGMPTGIFIPIISLGALVGALMSRLLLLMGMSAELVDSIVLISMAAIFASTVKAPLTAVIFVVEFTWSATLLLPVVLGVFIGYMLSELFRTKPIYDLLLEEMVESVTPRHFHHEYITVVEEDSSASGKAIRDVLWEDGILIHSIARDGEQLTPTSDTILQAGDKLTLHAEIVNVEEFEQRVEEIVKPRDHKPHLIMSKKLRAQLEAFKNGSLLALELSDSDAADGEDVKPSDSQNDEAIPSSATERDEKITSESEDGEISSDGEDEQMKTAKKENEDE